MFPFYVRWDGTIVMYALSGTNAAVLVALAGIAIICAVAGGILTLRERRQKRNQGPTTEKLPSLPEQDWAELRELIERENA